MVFGVIFGAATVYLALKAGLTVSASIPIAVLAISVLQAARLRRRSSRTTSSRRSARPANRSRPASSSRCRASCSWRATPPPARASASRTSRYWTILTLALLGGVLGVLMMIPLRRSLIVKEHGNLPYPEGHGLRARCSSPARRAATWRARRLQRPGLRVRLRPAAEGLPRHRRDAGAASSSRRTATCRRPSSTARSRPSTWASATSSARGSPACSSRAACSPGSGSSRCSRC